MANLHNKIILGELARRQSCFLKFFTICQHIRLEEKKTSIESIKNSMDVLKRIQLVLSQFKE